MPVPAACSAASSPLLPMSSCARCRRLQRKLASHSKLIERIWKIYIELIELPIQMTRITRRWIQCFPKPIKNRIFFAWFAYLLTLCWSELNVKTQSAIHSSPKVQILGVKWECASRICFWKRVCWHLWVPCFEMQMRWGSPMQAKMFTSCQIMSVCSVSCQSLLCCWPAYDFIWKLHFFFCPDFVATNQ